MLQGNRFERMCAYVLEDNARALQRTFWRALWDACILKNGASKMGAKGARNEAYTRQA
jgi:hypothetical protein